MASEKIMNFVEEIKKLSVLELSELVDAIQEEFGVTAAVAAAPAAGAAGAGDRGRGAVKEHSYGTFDFHSRFYRQHRPADRCRRGASGAKRPCADDEPQHSARRGAGAPPASGVRRRDG